MKRFPAFSVLLPLAALAMIGCSGGGSSQSSMASGAQPTANALHSAVFVTGEDAPIPSVLSFNLDDCARVHRYSRPDIISTAMVDLFRQ
jgi:hypothetical protein